MSVAYCSVMHNEEDIVYWQLLYYYGIGVRDFWIAFNTADDLTQTMVHAFAHNHPEAAVHTYIDPNRSYENQGSCRMALYRKAGRAGFDWILPVDADELITMHDPNLRMGFNLPAYLDKEYGHVQPNSGIKFSCYNYYPLPNDDWFEPNPFKRITYRTGRIMGKVIWRYGEKSGIFHGGHSVMQGEHDRKWIHDSEHKPMTAHYPHRLPIQVIKKRVAFGEAATHDYVTPDLEDITIPDDVDYNPPKTFTGSQEKKSIARQENQAFCLEILLDPDSARDVMVHNANYDLVEDSVWETTFG